MDGQVELTFVRVPSFYDRRLAERGLFHYTYQQKGAPLLFRIGTPSTSSTQLGYA